MSKKTFSIEEIKEILNECDYRWRKPSDSKFYSEFEKGICLGERTMWGDIADMFTVYLDKEQHEEFQKSVGRSRK